jgi:extracellular elastinolytic metalloproteinase
MSPIVMADRGNCTFVTKVRNIEKIGVKLAIICDNKQEFSENVIMGDDGSGGSVNIPSFIIRKQDCDAIKDAIKEGN